MPRSPQKDDATLMPSSELIYLLLSRRQNAELIDTLSAGLTGSVTSNKNIISGWRIYFKWLDEQGIALLEVGIAQAKAYASWLKNKYEAPATLNNRLTQVRRLYEILIQAGIKVENAFHSIQGELNPADERRPVYSREEISKLLNHSDEESKLLILLGANMGLTGPEVLNLTFESFSEDQLHIIGKRPRSIKCTKDVMYLVGRLRKKRGEQPIFDISAKGLVFNIETEETLRAKIFSLCGKANIEYKSWRALRSAAGIRMLQEGNAQSAAKSLGVGGRAALNPAVRLAKKSKLAKNSQVRPKSKELEDTDGK